MTKRFNQIGEFMESVRALTAQATELRITSETINHISALDPEFAQDVENLMSIFTNTTTTTAATTPTATATEMPTATAETSTGVEALKEIVSSTISTVVNVDTTPTTNELWKQHPDLEGVEVSTLGRIRVNGKPVEPRMIGGYMKFYCSPGKCYALAAAVLTTFSGHTGNSMVPVYKDGNKENCRLDNLRWGLRECTLSASAVERACALIAENPRLSESELLNLLVKEKTIRSITALRSILGGNWRTISDRYFVVRRGSIIPTTTGTTTFTTTTIQPTETEPEVDDSGNLNGILGLTNDPAFVRKLYSERVDAKQVSADDQVALILSYIMDGKDKVQDIQRAIHKDFGKRVMISNAEIQRIIG